MELSGEDRLFELLLLRIALAVDVELVNAAPRALKGPELDEDCLGAGEGDRLRLNSLTRRESLWLGTSAEDEEAGVDDRSIEFDPWGCY